MNLVIHICRSNDDGGAQWFGEWLTWHLADLALEWQHDHQPVTQDHDHKNHDKLMKEDDDHDDHDVANLWIASDPRS